MGHNQKFFIRMLLFFILGDLIAPALAPKISEMSIQNHTLTKPPSTGLHFSWQPFETLLALDTVYLPNPQLPGTFFKHKDAYPHMKKVFDEASDIFPQVDFYTYLAPQPDLKSKDPSLVLIAHVLFEYAIALEWVNRGNFPVTCINFTSTGVFSALFLSESLNLAEGLPFMKEIYDYIFEEAHRIQSQKHTVDVVLSGAPPEDIMTLVRSIININPLLINKVFIKEIRLQHELIVCGEKEAVEALSDLFQNVSESPLLKSNNYFLPTDPFGEIIAPDQRHQAGLIQPDLPVHTPLIKPPSWWGKSLSRLTLSKPRFPVIGQGYEKSLKDTPHSIPDSITEAVFGIINTEGTFTTLMMNAELVASSGTPQWYIDALNKGLVRGPVACMIDPAQTDFRKIEKESREIYSRAGLIIQNFIRHSAARRKVPYHEYESSAVDWWALAGNKILNFISKKEALSLNESLHWLRKPENADVFFNTFEILTHCPACKTEEISPDSVYFNGLLEIQACSYCSHKYQRRQLLLPYTVTPFPMRLPPGQPKIGQNSGKNQKSFQWILHKLKQAKLWNEDSVLVEIGCGRGEFIQYLQAIGYPGTIIGLDPDKDSILYAQSQLQPVNGHDRITFYHGTLTSFLKSSPDAPDTFILIKSLEHLYELRNHWQQISHRLKQGGRVLAIEVPNHDTRSFAWNIFGPGHTTFDYWPDHLHFFTEHSLTTLSSQMGFDLHLDPSDLQIQLSGLNAELYCLGHTDYFPQWVNGIVHYDDKMTASFLESWRLLNPEKANLLSMPPFHQASDIESWLGQLPNHQLLLWNAEFVKSSGVPFTHPTQTSA